MYTQQMDRYRCSRLSIIWKVILPAIIFLLPGVAMADYKPDIAVVYPLVREPFAALYRDYVVGITESTPDNLRQFHVNGDGREVLSRISLQTPPDVYIALGNKSVEIISSLNIKKPIVAVVSDREHEDKITSGILLKPPADVYLASLLDIHKGVKEVYVVYNPENDQLLIDEARLFLSQKGIKINAIAASNIRQAASGYQSILKNAKAFSAVWLLPDSSFLDMSLLSTVLDVAWEKKLIVFSSNPLFVKHGALFAIYPDNKKIGLTLGLIAQEVHDNKPHGLQSLRDVRLAVNQRTLNHLGIELSPQVKAKIELMLPGR
ncbi:MAG: hypothetical protein VR73_15735 [Gammaproteobacteria bacterium BRH_c0]|nr:MAG: hypothetical protein VR73_15735 [Gammaproteobacteria bacterium BRH_c0]